jgi:hypothetical protein
MLNREIANRVITENLNKLISQNLVEKVIDGKHVKYRLTKQYTTKQVHLTLQKLLEDIGEKYIILPYGLKDEDPPSIIITEKIKMAARMLCQDTLNIEPEEWYSLPEASRAIYFDYHIVDFSNVADILARRMMEQFQAYPPEKQEETKRLLLWAYWAGVQSYISSEKPFPLIKLLDKTEEYSKEIKKKMESKYNETKDEYALRRMKAEDELLQIISIIKELIRKQNLHEFLEYMFKKRRIVKKLKSDILRKVDGFLGGENFFDIFLDLHGMILYGLEEARLLTNEENEMYIRYYGDVWNTFIGFILNELLWAGSPILSNIKGGVDEAVSMVKFYKDGLKTLCELPFQSKTLIIYLWGYPEVSMLSDKSLLPYFDRWFQALKKGDIDHRTYLFSPDVEQKLLNASRNVNRGISPPDEKVDFKEIWTLRDLYENHPRGKEPNFYKEILNIIKERRSHNPFLQFKNTNS